MHVGNVHKAVGFGNTQRNALPFSRRAAVPLVDNGTPTRLQANAKPYGAAAPYGSVWGVSGKIIDLFSVLVTRRSVH